MNTTHCLCCGELLAEADGCYHAKCARKLFGSSRIPVFNYTQEELNLLAKRIVMERVSVPGVQPKLSLHLERGNAVSRSRLTLVGLEGDYILKPQSPHWNHLPEAEFFCMLLARKCRICTVDFGLIPLNSGELAYITKRMDRHNGALLHLEDFCQILNKMTSQKYNGSMEQIGKALRAYSDVPGLDCIRFFELVVFSSLTGNSDMHLKNFSLLRHENGNYELSPAYDLVPVKVVLPQDNEELALTLNGKKNRLKRSDFDAFATSLKLTSVQADKALDRMMAAVSNNLFFALEASHLPEDMKLAIAELVNERMARLRG